MASSLFAVRLLMLAGLALAVGPAAATTGPTTPVIPTSASAAGQDAAGALGVAAAPRESWEGVAHRLAVSLVDAEARIHEEPLFLPMAQVRPFGRRDVQSPNTLSEQFDGWRVVGVQSFVYPVATLAGDTGLLVQRLRERDPAAVPELLARALTPPPEEVSAAEQAATRWITAALSPQRGDHLAMVMLWDPTDVNRPMLERLSFVLIKAGRLPDGRFRVQTVSYGTAQQAVLEGA